MKNFGKTTDIRDIITVGYEADNAVLYSTSQSLTNDQKIQARANIGAGTSNFDGDYKSLANKPTIPTKTSQLDNDSNFATTSQVEAKYTKPSGGIPKTDLATAVQNSLTAADNAVKYTSQSLTDAQKEQARKNIGAGTSSFSGNYKDLADKPDIPDAVSIVQSTGESTSSVMSQKATTNAVNGRLSKTDNTNIEVLGTKKATTTLGGNQLYAPSGVIFGGTAAAAGLVTRGICGITTPSAGGACSKENLYINYDGNNDFNAGRQVVLNAGTVGNHLGSNMYQYTVPRGEIVKNWVEAKGYATSVKVNGNTIASSGGVVDIGTVVSSVNGSSGAITNVAKTDETNVFTNSQIILRPSDETQASLWNYSGCIAYSHWVQGSSSEPRIGIGYKNSGIRVFNGTTETPMQYYDVTMPPQAGQLVTDTFAKFTGETSGIGHPYRVFPNEEAYVAYQSNPQNVKYTSQTNLALIVNTDANSRTVFTDGRIDNKKNGTKYELTLPTNTGTLALTSDIPTVNNGTLTIQKNGTKVQTFTANQSSSVTANITVPTKASDVNALSLDGGTINKSKTIKMDASANSDGANLKWGTVNHKNPYIGYASDQVDGTFVVGSLLGTNYASGLAIGGGSGNLLWKGTKVATTSDIPTNYVTTDTTQTISGAKTFTSDVVINKATPNINVTHTGLTDGTNPTSNIYSGLNFEEKDGKNLSEFRNQVTSAGRVSTDLWTRSFGTDYGNYVGLFAAPNAGASNSTDVWHFSPNLDAIIDLGQSNLRWRNVRAVTTYSNVYGSDLCSTNSLRLKDPNITRGTNQAASGGKQNYYRAININDKNNHKGVAVEWGYLCEKNSNGNTTKHVSELNLLVYPPNTTDNANFVKVALGKRSDGTTYFTYAGNQVVTTQNFSLSGTTLTITL